MWYTKRKTERDAHNCEGLHFSLLVRTNNPAQEHTNARSRLSCRLADQTAHHRSRTPGFEAERDEFENGN